MPSPFPDRRLLSMAVVFSLIAGCGGDGTGPDPDPDPDPDPGPSPLVISVDGRLERSEVVTLSATRDGAEVGAGQVTWSADPAAAVELLGGGEARLLDDGSVTISAAYDGSTGERSIEVDVPPMVVFSMSRDGNRDLWKAAIDGGDLARLTGGSGDALSPTVAGATVVFISFRDGNGNLYSIPLAGGSETRLTSTAANEGDPALTRDGTRLAFTVDASGTPKLRTAAADASGSARGRTGGLAAGVEATPAWSPDGDRLVFLSTERGNADLFTAAPGGAAELFEATSSAEVSPAWSPDGLHVAFVSDRVDGDAEIFLHTVETGEVRRLTSREGADGDPTWTSDGRLVYVAWTDGEPALFWIDPATPEERHRIDVGPGSQPAVVP